MTASYLSRFASTKDFGPFFGFTRGCTTAAVMIVDDLAAVRSGAR
ncbi:MAG: hypothetical protein AB7V43_14495 [Acidimicrobiia bacterium]